MAKNAHEFTIYGDPVAQPRASKFFNKKTGKMHGYVKGDHKIHGWRNKITLAAQQIIKNGNFRFVNKPDCVMLDVKFWFLRPRSLPAKIKYHTKKPDLDNLIKAVKDSLEGVLYENDSQVFHEEILKGYTTDNPFVFIGIDSISGVADEKKQ